MRSFTRQFLFVLALPLAALAQPGSVTPTNSALTVNTSTGAVVAPVNAATFRSANDLQSATGAASSYQPLDGDLTSWAALTRSAGFDTFTVTPSSANLRSLLTDETGTGAAVFATSPTLVAPALGAATATSISGASGPLDLFATASGSAVALRGGGGAAGGVQVVMDATYDRGLAIGDPLMVAPTQGWPVRARFDRNSSVTFNLANANSGTSAYSDYRLENDNSNASFRLHSTTHSIWPSIAALSSSSSGGLALFTSSGPIDVWPAGVRTAQFHSAGGITLTPVAGQNLVIATSSNGQTLFANGTASRPSVSFSSDTDTGFYWESGDRIAITLGGTARFFLDTSSIQTPNGAASAPSLRFTSDGNTGVYRVGEDQLGVATGGVLRATVDASGNLVLATGRLIVSVSSPPASATATGTTGSIAWDTNFFYVAVATNTWRRVALSTW
jgi:hypothetical protein